MLLPSGLEEAKAGKGISRRPDIAGDPLQVTYGGEPLYRYVVDGKGVGVANGQG